MADNDNALAGFKILPIGFSSYEKATIEAFFRLASHRAPHWRLTSNANDARVVLLNATSKQVVDTFKSLVNSWQRVVIVGASDFGTGWTVVQRPLRLTEILHVLDQIVMDTKPVPAPAIFQLNEAPSFQSSEREVEIVLSPPKNANEMLSRVLIVDDSDIALKYMQTRLRHFGYESDLAKSGEEALVLAGERRYQFVFLDVMMDGMDGYKTCRAIKSKKTKNNKSLRDPSPVVVMLTSRGGTIDKIRGAMAGCDAYLTKPLNEKQLAAVLAKYDESEAQQRWDAVNHRTPVANKSAVN